MTAQRGSEGAHNVHVVSLALAGDTAGDGADVFLGPAPHNVSIRPGGIAVSLGERRSLLAQAGIVALVLATRLGEVVDEAGLGALGQAREVLSRDGNGEEGENSGPELHVGRWW